MRTQLGSNKIDTDRHAAREKQGKRKVGGSPSGKKCNLVVSSEERRRAAQTRATDERMEFRYNDGYILQFILETCGLSLAIVMETYFIWWLLVNGWWPAEMGFCEVFNCPKKFQHVLETTAPYCGTIDVFLSFCIDVQIIYFESVNFVPCMKRVFCVKAFICMSFICFLGYFFYFQQIIHVQKKYFTLFAFR